MHALLNNTLQLTVGPEARNELQRLQNVSDYEQFQDLTWWCGHRDRNRFQTIQSFGLVKA